MKKQFRIDPSLQILCAIAAGIALGYAAPARAIALRPLGDLFVDIIRILVGPIMFCTVTCGIAAMRNMRQLGEAGIKAIVYFETASLVALAAGIVGAWLLQPGAGFRLDQEAVAPMLHVASGHSGATSLLATLHTTFARTSLLQLLLCALACGIGLALAGERARRITDVGERISGWLFVAVNFVLKAAPLAAFGAIAYTVGRYGLVSVAPLLKLLGAIYLSTIVFAAVFFGMVGHCCGFSLWRLVVYLREELVLVVATASSVAAMPRLIDKLGRAGCPDALARVLVPIGYSFNLNGSSVYLTLALVFLAQASHVDLGAADYAAILAIAMMTSKGSSGIAGSAFVALSATLAVVPAIPEGSLLFILSIERLLKCRPLANVLGNGVACLAVAAWMGKLDRSKLRASFAGKPGGAGASSLRD
jgi:aerobic C4-dicarboxylate transport protein